MNRNLAKLLLASSILIGTINASTAADEALKITGVMAVINDPFFITMRCGALAAANEAGAELSWQGPTSDDAVKQLQTFNSVLVSQPDGVLVAPFLPKAFLGPIKTAMQKGIPVVVVDSELEEPVALKTVRTTVGDTVSELARAAGKLIGGKGVVAVIASSPGIPLELERYDGFVKTMAVEFPDITLLPVEYAKTDTATAARIMNAQIVGNPDLNLVYTTNGPQAAGIISAVKAANKTQKIKVFSYDAMPVQVDGLRKGEFSGLLAQSPYLEGYEATKTLLDYLSKNKDKKAVTPLVPQLMVAPMMLLTPENVDTDEAKKFIYATSCN